MQDLADAVASLLVQARSALFVTGSGLTTEAGLSVYRGIAGVPREDAATLEKALSIELFRAHPSTAWGYFIRMDEAIHAVEPTRAHRVIAALQADAVRSAIMTVNIDRLHQRAGSKDVIEMHGALNALACTRCDVTMHCDSFELLDHVPPKCRTCGATLRPDMPLFGEALPPDPMTRLQEELERGFDIVLAIGVSQMLPYLARPLLLAKSEGIPTVEIGNSTTELSDVVDFRFRGSPSRVLDLVFSSVKQLRTSVGR
jgi:NAD-dependent deacetylase